MLCMEPKHQQGEGIEKWLTTPNENRYGWKLKQSFLFKMEILADVTRNIWN